MAHIRWITAIVSAFTAVAVAGAPSTPEPSPSLSAPVPFVPTWSGVSEGLTLEERRVVKLVFNRIQKQEAPTGEEVETVERLVERYAQRAPLRALAEAALVTLASAEASGREYDAAIEHLRRAVDLNPAGTAAPLKRVDVLLILGRWDQAETEARDLLARFAECDEARLGLSYALLRQDRDQEASQAMESLTRLRDHPFARMVRDKLARNLKAEEHLREQRSRRFNLRYDGERHEAIGERVLALMDELYTRLSVTFMYAPADSIPVVILSREAYFDTTHAPRWSGGIFSSFDWRIRIPIQGLAVDQVLALDNALLHELTHAFVDSLSHGYADWELQEGLAQYMEGKRTPVPGTIAGAAPRRLTDVEERYLAALSWVEHLMDTGGQPAINALLMTLGRSGDSTQAFREAFGREAADLRADWLAEHPEFNHSVDVAPESSEGQTSCPTPEK